MKTVICVSIIVLSFFSNKLYSQSPSNDNCENAEEIIISDNGFGFGTFLSGKHNIEFATRQKAEKCAAELEDNGNCDKTVWFKFYIPTTRNISIKLTQKDSAIPQIFAGFNVYSINNCSYTLADLSKGITPINKFGQSGNTCLSEGWYLIQVASKQKAKGELWVELSSQVQQSTIYDNYTSPYDFGIIRDMNVSFSLYSGCASVEKLESLPINDSSLSKSVYCKFTLPANSIFNQISLYYSHKHIKYRIFKENINADSINGNKAFIELYGPSNKMILNSFCQNAVNSDEIFYFQFVTESPQDQYININIHNSTYQNDLWNTPNTDDIINTYNGYSRNKPHKYNCEGILKNHSCKSIIPEFFTRKYSYYPGDTMVDTFDMAGYTVINSSNEGVLKAAMKNLYGYNSRLQYAIYEGDITQGCNLKLVKSEYTQDFTFCIGIGKYTLVIAAPKLQSLDLGTQIISQAQSNLNIQHYKPPIAENIGNLVPSNTPIIYGSTVNFRQSNDTTLTVDTFKIHGYFIYREFYLAEKRNISISEANYITPKYYLFKGQISRENVSLIDKFIYTKYNNSYSNPNCQALEPGWFTIVNWLDTSKKSDFCIAPYSKITVSANSKCQRDTSNYAKSAIKINNLNNVLASNPNKINLDYVYKLPLCIDCAEPTEKPKLLQYKKRFIYESTKYSYFVFYLGQDAEFRINLNESNFELYKGNSNINNQLIHDTNNIVSACNNGNIYCNLTGGKFYTLALFNISNVNDLKVYFTPHRISPNDYAMKSYNLGHFDANGTRSSAPMPITCHTNGSKNDPCGFENGNKRCLYDYNHEVFIPWKDTLDVKRYYMRKNIWYTFTVDKSSDITVTLRGATTLARVRMFNVFRYDGPYNADFNNMIMQGFDSTEKSLKWLATNPRTYTSLETRRESVTINNTGCTPNRYFVLVEDDFLQQDPSRYEYIITVNYNQRNYPIIGDFCDDPSNVNITGYGTQTTTLNNTCHTFGNSPYEDNKSDKLKSSWFKINISNLNKCDLSIKNTSGFGLLYYTVYGGNCNALTKVTHVTDVNAYLTLSCMGPGDYYIQAVCDNSKNANIAFEIGALIPENPNCKPYNFDNPLAQFKITGGCNNDTVKFENISTSGQFIQYSWYINGILFSNNSQPILTIQNPLVLKSSNQIKLVVKNSDKNTYDSITQIFQPDTNNYFFNAFGPSNVSCLDTVTLDINTNFPYKINYKWTSPNETNAYLSKSIQLLTVRSDRTFFIYGESDNCIFRDTFTLTYTKEENLFRDTSICAKDVKLKLSTKNAVWFYLNNTRITEDFFTLSQAGTYLLYYNISGCPIEEKIEIEIDSTTTTLYLNDTIEVCNKDSFDFEFKKYVLKNPIWNTGNSNQKININKAGIYILQGSMNSCRNIEYSLDARFRKKEIDLLHDTILCYLDTFYFNQKFSGYQLLEKHPIEEKIIAKKAFKIKMKLDDGLCIVNDSAAIDVIQTNTENKEILYCDSTGNSFLTLDGGKADLYNWIGLNESQQYLNVNKYGEYVLERTHKGYCKDSMFFLVTENCPLDIFIPNSFTPNGDLNNDIFKPFIVGRYLSFEMTIFNRWGEILYQGDAKGWNGRYMDQLVMEGVYCYLINITDKNGKLLTLRGTFTVMY